LILVHSVLRLKRVRMLRRIYFIPALLIAVFLLLTTPAAADSLIANNLPINGQLGSFQISGSGAVSDSFAVSGNYTVSTVVFGAWVDPGDSVTSVDWMIGTFPFDDDIGSGEAETLSFLDFTNTDSYDVDAVVVPIPNLPLSTGTYYLTLLNAMSSSGSPVYWDINNGIGVDAWDSALGNVSAPGACDAAIGVPGSCASSFEIGGVDPPGVPEPSTWALLGIGILAAAALRRRLIYR
jgi:hypothetical protein